MRKLLWLVPVAFFFLNPAIACSDDPDFQYGAPEMRAAVEGDWSFTITPDNGSAVALTVHIQQGVAFSTAARNSGRSFVRAAYACGTRTLVKSAGACVDSTQMPLGVTFVTGDTTFALLALNGTFTVNGLTFVSGDLDLVLGPYQIKVQVNADGSAVNPRLVPATGNPTGTVTVSRP